MDYSIFFKLVYLQNNPFHNSLIWQLSFFTYAIKNKHATATYNFLKEIPQAGRQTKVLVNFLS